MDLTTAITSRHSTRAFTDEPVGRETITEIVALARRAPSWVDSQPWRVYAAIGAARERIARRHAESSTSGARAVPTSRRCTAINGRRRSSGTWPG